MRVFKTEFLAGLALLLSLAASGCTRNTTVDADDVFAPPAEPSGPSPGLVVPVADPGSSPTVFTPAGSRTAGTLVIPPAIIRPIPPGAAPGTYYPPTGTYPPPAPPQPLPPVTALPPIQGPGSEVSIDCSAPKSKAALAYCRSRR